MLLVDPWDKYGDRPQVCLSCFSHLIPASTSWLVLVLVDREVELEGKIMVRVAAKELLGWLRIGDTLSLEILGAPHLGLGPRGR